MEDKNQHENELKIFNHTPIISSFYNEKNIFTGTRNHNSPKADNINKIKSKNKNILIHSMDIKEMKRPITRGTSSFIENKLSMVKNITSDVNTNENNNHIKKINKIYLTKLRKRRELIFPLAINSPLQRDKKINYFNNTLKKSSDNFKDSKMKISQNPIRIFKSNLDVHHLSPEQKLKGLTNTIKLPIKIASQKEFIHLNRNTPININIENININNYNLPFINDTRKMTPSNRRIDKKEKIDNTHKKKIIDINYIDENNDSFINELNVILKEVDDSKFKDGFKDIEINLNKYNYSNVNSQAKTSYKGIN